MRRRDGMGGAARSSCLRAGRRVLGVCEVEVKMSSKYLKITWRLSGERETGRVVAQSGYVSRAPQL